MAETPDVSEADIENVDLTQTDIAAPTASDAPAPAADDKPDEGAAADEPAKPADDAAKPDAADTTAKDKPADPAAPADGKPAEGGDKPAEGDQKPADQAAADAQKSPEQLREEQQARARMEYQNRQRTRSQIAQQLDQNFGPKTEEDLVQEGMPAEDAKIEALRQDMLYREQRAQISELNAGMQAEAVNVEADFGLFNPKSPDYDKEYTEMVDAQYKTAARLQTEVVKDAQGRETEIIVNAEVPLYDFYQRMADIYSRGASKGAKVGQQEMQEMLARTENPGGSSSTGNQPGSIEEMEERLGGVVIT